MPMVKPIAIKMPYQTTTTIGTSRGNRGQGGNSKPSTIDKGKGKVTNTLVTAQIVHGPILYTVPAQNISLKNKAIKLYINIQIVSKFSIIDFRALQFNLS